MNLDRDLQAVGLADLITSIGGGPVGYPSASLSILPNRIGARSHLVGVFVSILFALTLFVGGGLLAYLPRVVIGGLLVYFGVDLLYHWVIRTRKTLPKYDYYVLLLILLVIVAVDLLTGVVVGILAAVVLFAVNYSKTPVIRHTLSGETFRSNVERAEYHRQYLQSQGNRLLILRLQGFIFFGTAFQLFQEVRQRVEDPHLPPLDFLVMDFRLVSGADSSAMHSFVRMLQLAESRDFTLALSDLPESLREQIAITRTLIEDEAVRVRIFPDLDHAVEWCEDTLLYKEGVTVVSQPPLAEVLRAYFPAPEDVETFMSYLERREVPINTVIIHQGDPPGSLYFVSRGQVRVEMSQPSGETIRLRTMSEGTIIGELGLYLHKPASANVIAELPSVLYYLSADSLTAMEQGDPHIAAIFHKYLATALSKRLLDTNATVQALMG